MNFSDSLRYAVGATYQINSDVTLRTAIAYDQTPTNKDHRSISIPDSDQIWISGGVNYSFDNQSSIGFGVSVIQGNTKTCTEMDDLDQQSIFESEDDAYIVSAQYNHVF